MELQAIRELQACLLSPTEPIAKRIRSVFHLRSHGTAEAAAVLELAIRDPSALLKHEICYALGQMRLSASVPFLISVVEDAGQETIVRHEAAEALGAIGEEQGRAVLQKYVGQSDRELSETCYLALKRLDWLRSGETAPISQFSVAVDPAPAFAESRSLEDLAALYNNPSADLFDRYRALFSLRDLCTQESLDILAQGLGKPDFSPLFKHEIAFVLGELSERAVSTASYLEAAVTDQSNHCMVRHEASEALAEVRQSPQTATFLMPYLQDTAQVVRESCEVALDILQYWTSSEV